TGLLGGVNHQQLVQGIVPRARGINLGTEQNIHGTRVECILDTAPHPGDGIAFAGQNPEKPDIGGTIYAVHRAQGKGRYSLYLGPTFAYGKVYRGYEVWLTRDRALQNE